MEVGDGLVGAVVLNMGHWETKVGEAGEDTPKYVFPTPVGCIDPSASADLRLIGTKKAPHPQSMDLEPGSQPQKSYFVGTNQTVYRDFMAMESPFKDGKIADWDVFHQIVQHAYTHGLHMDPGDNPLLMTEPSDNTSEQRQKLASIIFETYKPAGFFLSKEATLSCYASGRATSLVVDVGHYKTVVSSVHDGYVLQKTIQESHVAGNALSTALIQALQQKTQKQLLPKFMFSKTSHAQGKPRVTPLDRSLGAYSYFYHHQLQLADDIKQNSCATSTQGNQDLSPSLYELPDGSTISVDSERHSIPELLFTSQNGAPAVPQMIMNCASTADVDIRKELFGGIIVTGGSSLFPGFTERLSKSLNIPTMYKAKFISHDPIERKFSSWIGGSILASLPSMSSLWIDPKEFEETGPYIVDKKCP